MTRPLPEVNAQNEFFWTAGADGVLRIQECKDCDALIHPPQPVCRYCRGRNMGVRDVSGEATLSAFTVNHRFGFPDLPPPYVVAQVAIVEDPRVRLTTNIVDCDPDDLEMGQTVAVQFDKAEDKVGTVWLPVFKPTAEKKTGPQAVDEIAPQDFGKHVSPMLTEKKFEDAAAITGIGMSKIGRRQMVPPLSLTIDACQQAVADAGLTFDDIDGLSTYPGLDIAGMGEGGVTALEGALGLRPAWINGGMDTFGPGGSLIAAVMAVATGMARHVLCFRTLWEATFQQLMKEGKMSPPGGARTSSWQMPFGATSAAHTLALNAQRHFARYGTTQGDPRLDRVEPEGQCGAEPDRYLPRSDDHGRLFERTADHHAVRAVRLRRAVRRRDRGGRFCRRCREGHAAASPCCSRRSAPRSSNGPTGTRPR